MKGAFSTPVCARKQTNGLPVIAATATARCQAEWWTHPLPPVLPFLLAQNLSSKRIAPTDNMRPKSDDAKRRHRLLRGLHWNFKLILPPSTNLLDCLMLCYVPQEVQGFKTVGEMERFLLEHGEQIVDVLGSEVDRIEDRIKVSV